MPKKRHKPEEIVSKLRQADVLISQGQDIANVIRQIGVSEGHLLSVALGVRQAEDRAGQAPEGAREGEYPSAQGDLRPDAGQTHLAGGRTGRLLSPGRRRACIEQVREVLHVSERRACAALGQHRSTQRKIPRGRDDKERLTADVRG
jgi:hypothetical protein